MTTISKSWQVTSTPGAWVTPEADNRAGQEMTAGIRGGKVEGYVSSKSHLDAINHNYEIFATPTEVRECWNTIRAFLLFMLKP